MSVVSAAVEGLLDEAVVSRLIAHVGHELGPVFGRRGRAHLLGRTPAYNHAARHSPWFVLADLDRDECAPALIAKALPSPAPHMRLRIAVPEVESWLLGDRDRMAAFLSVPIAAITHNPEALADPKAEMLRLVSHSRSASLRRRMARHPHTAHIAGTGYTAALMEYVAGPWRPDVASDHADSLRRAIAALRGL